MREFVDILYALEVGVGLGVELAPGRQRYREHTPLMVIESSTSHFKGPVAIQSHEDTRCAHSPFRSAGLLGFEWRISSLGFHCMAVIPREMMN